MAKNPTPTAYRAPTLPPDPANLPTYLARELRSLERVIDGLLDFLPRDANAAPRNPLVGMIRRAVAPWRPVAGQSSDRWVQYDGTQWTYLAGA